MSTIRTADGELWVGIRAASHALGMTGYSVQRLALEGHIRTRPYPPFRTLFNLRDLQRLCSAYDRPGSPLRALSELQSSSSARQLQPA